MLFEDKPHYWEPADQLERIYDQLSQNKCREIPREDLTYGQKQLVLSFFENTSTHPLRFTRLTAVIGSGEFGTVSKATWKMRRGGGMDVAVKQLKMDASEEDRKKFLREGARMMQFFHTNVVKLHGMVTVGQIVSINNI